MKVYQKIARTLGAIKNCRWSGNKYWEEYRKDELEALIKERLPSGSGFDAGTTLLLDTSDPDRLVFYTEFHHMSEHGHYDGWTRHWITVTPSLAFGCRIQVLGEDRDGILEYIEDVFHEALTADV